jgi:RNA polymerase sigma factor (sigma-70 family)
MAAVRLRQVVRQLRGVLAARQTAGLTDADLWERYVGKRDEAAFEAIVRRHGPMVLGVCRRILRHEQDVEDAFQATFLVLVRRAASLRSPHTLANWLYGVARRTALEARRSAAHRRAKEAAVLPRIVMPDEPCDDLRFVLDQELERLAERFRVAVILCDLEGKTRKEVARQLGWAEGTVASRLARGRDILAKRLARRGFAGALVAAALAEGNAPAGVPSPLVVSTVKAASFSAARGVLSGTVAALTEGVLKSMLLTKLKSAIAVLLMIGMTALSAGVLISWSRATGPAEAAASGPKSEQANRDDLHDRVLELKRQLQLMQEKISRLEQETQPRREERNPRDAFPANRFKHRVPFEIGFTETKEGGRIEIQEVWGTRPRIEPGGQYLVRGKYTLPTGKRGTLYFFETATGNWTQTSAIMDLQNITLDKEKGEFTLMHGMEGPGYFHLILTDPERYSQWFANVYFGTGDNVLRKKSW